MAVAMSAAIVGSMSPAATAVRVEMVADVVCPYCHIGLVRLRKAIAMAGAKVDIQYTPFILRRHLPKEGVGKREVFRQQFGNDAHGERVIQQVKATALQSGLQFNLSEQRAGNSEDAHRLLLWSGPRALDLFESMAMACTLLQAGIEPSSFASAA